MRQEPILFNISVMKKWIALLRGINVGGNNILPMENLRSVLEALEFQNVKTCIQSGNCVFESTRTDPSTISTIISTTIEGQFGLQPRVITFSHAGLESAIRNNPYPEAKDNPKSVHLYFLSEAVVDADLDALC